MADMNIPSGDPGLDAKAAAAREQAIRNANKEAEAQMEANEIKSQKKIVEAYTGI